MKLSSPREVLTRHGVSARKSWGQHFLRDPAVHRAIVGATGAGPNDRVIEIGAGLGTLTQYLLETGADVWALERDRDLCRVLRHELGALPNFTLHECDAVKFDYREAAGERPPVIVGNLPYHLTAPLLYRLLESSFMTGPWIVMIQKEVADRILSAPGCKSYGSMTIGLGRLRVARKIVDVGAGAFVPAPKVDSTVLRLDPRAQPVGQEVDASGFLELVRTTFMRRRKTLSNALAPLAPRPVLQRWCDAAGVDHCLRPERLRVEQFVALQYAREHDA